MDFATEAFGRFLPLAWGSKPFDPLTIGLTRKIYGVIFAIANVTSRVT
jgi:hypothetical protein